MSGIYRADDIRGEFGKDLTLDESRRIGFAINKYVKGKKLILAYDNRLSSQKLKKAFVSELDKEVIDLGIVPTPVFYFALDLYKQYFGVMITASHLPKQFNGFKINKGPWSLTYSTGINKIESIAKRYKKNKHNPKIKKIDVTRRYYKFIVSKIKLKRPLTVAVDGGNGIAGKFLVKSLKKFGCRVIELYCKPDGNFPHHVPNPLIDETLRDLQTLIKKKKVDIGIALDGDGDRIRLVSPNAEILDNEVIISLLAKYILVKKPHANVVYSSICSDLVKFIVKKYKGTAIMEKVGHSFIKNTSIRKRAILSGEYSGHIGFKEINYNDDGIYASLKLCELLSNYPTFWEEAKYLSSLFLAPHEIRINVKESAKDFIMNHFFNRFKNFKKSKKDGLRIYFGRVSWALIRPSNTEAMISIRFQAKNKSELKLIRGLILREIKKRKIEPKFVLFPIY